MPMEFLVIHKRKKIMMMRESTVHLTNKVLKQDKTVNFTAPKTGKTQVNRNNTLTTEIAQAKSTINTTGKEIKKLRKRQESSLSNFSVNSRNTTIT